MTHPDRAIEAGARAAHHATPRNKPYDKLTLFKKNLYRTEATAAITAYLAQAGKEGLVMVPAKPIDWFNPWNDYHGFQQVAEEYEGGGEVYPFYADQKAHDDLAAAQNGGE